ncbi:MAG TPA: tetratricopeptide repeat protein [Coleofasciculaceae cyanobacterium]|jgi:tetratricopeptide (TPR) repeat protein
MPYRPKLIRSVLACCLLLGQLQAWAEGAGSRITSVNLDKDGNIVLSVSGEGIDPMMRLEPTGEAGRYRILIRVEHASMEDSLRKDIERLSNALGREIPAVESVDFIQERDSGHPGVRLVLLSWQRLQPQVRSNTGSTVTISLVGERNLPPERIAALKKQEEARRADELRRQEEARIAEQHRLAEERLAKSRALEQSQREWRDTDDSVMSENPPTPEEPWETTAEPVIKLSPAKSLKSVAVAAKRPPAKPMTASGVKPLAGVQLKPREPQGEAMTLLQKLEMDVTPPPSAAPKKGSMSGAIAMGVTPAQARANNLKRLAGDLPQPPGQAQNVYSRPGGSSSQPDGMDGKDTEPLDPIRLKPTPPGFQPDSDDEGPEAPGLNQSPQGTQPGLYAQLASGKASSAVRLSWQQLQQGNATAAELGLRNHLEKSPQDVTARYLLAKILLSPLGDVSVHGGKVSPEATARREAARQELLKITAATLYLPAYTALVDLYLNEGNTEDAGRLLNKLSIRYPHEPAILLAQGRLHEAMDDLPGARDAYTQALARQPENPEIFYRLAQLEINGEHPDAARWALLQGLAIAPDDARMWKLLGFIAEKQGNPGEAAHYYQSAIPPDALINAGRMLDARNQPEKALAMYTAAETLAADDADVLYNLGMVYAGLKQEDRAASAFKRFLEAEKDPQSKRIAKARDMLRQLGHKPAGGIRTRILPF